MVGAAGSCTPSGNTDRVAVWRRIALPPSGPAHEKWTTEELRSRGGWERNRSSLAEPVLLPDRATRARSDFYQTSGVTNGTLIACKLGIIGSTEFRAAPSGEGHHV
ncbi:hypothetical protein NDU88_001228 [Pleurodeles waltl]|uniref:Uncharacterized protein n=1 Tax=Pleurodeles waltl TaxID=8319 RepID=A0AAV7U7U2_PLEWA|nr:hypothetical protein NDU88_001228 [Pleurodeles waltl]